MSTGWTAWLRLERAVVFRIYLVLLGIIWMATGAGVILGTRTPLLNSSVQLSLCYLLAAITSSCFYLYRSGRWQRVLPAFLLMLYVSAAVLAWSDELEQASRFLALCVLAPLLQYLRVWLGLLLVAAFWLTPSLLGVMVTLRSPMPEYSFMPIWRLIWSSAVPSMIMVPLLILLLKADSGPRPRHDLAAGLLRRNRMTQRGFTLIELLIICALIGIFAGTIVGEISNSRRIQRVGQEQARAWQLCSSALEYFQVQPPAAAGVLPLPELLQPALAAIPGAGGGCHVQPGPEAGLWEITIAIDWPRSRRISGPVTCQALCRKAGAP